jgi:hypothetical protein
MTIKPNDFYNKLGEWCDGGIVSLFYDLTAYLMSSIKMENTDDVEYNFTGADKSMYMIIIGKEDSVKIDIRPEGIPKGDAIVYVTYYIRRRDLESIYGDKRVAVCDAGQWRINSKGLNLEEYEGRKTLNHFDVVKEIMKSHK